MGEINLVIHGKSYPITCDDGQESRVLAMAKYVDGRVREIALSGAASNESHLLALASLMIADELHDMKESLRQASAAAQKVSQRITAEEEQQISDAIQHLATRIDSVAQRLQDIQ